MTSPLQSRIADLAAQFLARYDEPYTLDRLREIWQSDLPSDYTAFRHTAEYCADHLRRIGVEEVEIVPCPADGRTRVQAWTMPLAWEGGDAVLRIVSPHEETLCDRHEQPLSCVMWSEPTPPEGVTGPLVIVDDPAAVPAEQRAKLRGAFLLSRLGGRGVLKVFAAEVGAAAIVSQNVYHAERHRDAIAWCNGWADDAGAWALKAADHRMTGFQISAPVGDHLRALLQRGPVTCHARVGGRVGPGELPIVTGVIPGQSRDEEILLDGHLYEIGANDNASGAASMIEIMRMLAATGTPRRTVRILLTSECYGTYSLYTARPHLLERTVAGLNIDCVGETETDDRPVQFYRTPEAAPSAVDSLLREAMRATEPLPGARRAKEHGHGLSDNVMCDPAAAGGVAMICLMKAPWHWHTNLDDWSQIDPAAQRRATVAAAAYVRWLADASPEDADALAEAALADARADFPEGGPLPADRRAFFLDRARSRILWTRRLGATRADAVAAKLPRLDVASLVTDEDGPAEARTTVPVRSFWGAPTFDEIPIAQREGLDDPRWNAPLTAASYWADGRRSVAEIAALVRLEFGKPQGDLLRFFRVLTRGGLVRLEQRK